MAPAARSPQRQGRLHHASDAGLDEGEVSVRQVTAFVLGDIPDLSGDSL